MSELLELDDRQTAAGGPGIYHIGEILPIVLARIPATTQNDMGCHPRPARASHLMPYPGVSADTQLHGQGGRKMLVLSRKQGDSIQIGDGIRVVVLEIRGNSIRLGIEAPTEVSVRRSELPADDRRKLLPR